MMTVAGGCTSAPQQLGGPIATVPLETVALLPGKQVTGVAVTREGRVFVNSPRWSDDFNGLSVAELLPGGTLRPVPSSAFNAWAPAGSTPWGGAATDATMDTPAPTPQGAWVCVQSVHVDRKNRLWVLDPASPKFGGVVEGGAKLVELDPSGDKVLRTISFDASVAPAKSYLNDVRIDTATETAFITDSGIGGIVVVNLADGSARRVLDGNPAVMGDPAVVPVVQGVPLRAGGQPDGEPVTVHSDGIALDQVRGYLYWQALTGKTLYRIKTRFLRDATLSAERLAGEVENLGTTVVTDGMEIDEQGNIFFSSLETDAIVMRIPEGRLLTLAQDEQLSWPDSFAFGPGGTLYVTSARIHQTAGFKADASQPDPATQPFGVFRILLPESVRRLPSRR